MKSTKKDKNPAPLGTSDAPAGAPQPRPVTLEQTLHADFEGFCKAMFPEAFSEPEDQQVLRATWMAATRQAMARISMVAIKPMHTAAEAECGKLLPNPPVA